MSKTRLIAAAALLFALAALAMPAHAIGFVPQASTPAPLACSEEVSSPAAALPDFGETAQEPTEMIFCPRIPANCCYTETSPSGCPVCACLIGQACC